MYYHQNMKEYFGKRAKGYKQTKGKEYILFPALGKYIHQSKPSQKKLLDVGCGNGDLYELAKEKGHSYYGLDISKEMIQRAKDEYPKGTFLVSSATDFASKYGQAFDVIVISMLFPSLRSKEDIAQTLKESKKVLAKNGTILIGLPYPCFDGYMQGGLFGRKGVTADFREGYFKSKAEFTLIHQVDGGTFTFEDCHWTLADYVDCIKKAGLSIEYIDECKPESSLRRIDKEFYEERIRFPTYMVIVVK